MAAGKDDAMEKSDSKDKISPSKVKEKSAIFIDRGICVRADRIDFKDWDKQLDRHLSKVLSRASSGEKKEDWEIDYSKLDIKRAIDHGAYGTVYRGLYDGQDVAGKFLLHLQCSDHALIFAHDSRLDQ